MGREAGDRPPVANPAEAEDALNLFERRLKLLKIAAGVPGLILSIFGLLLAYRLANRPFGDCEFWFALLGIVAVFAAYFGYCAWGLRKS